MGNEISKCYKDEQCEDDGNKPRLSTYMVYKKSVEGNETCS